MGKEEKKEEEITPKDVMEEIAGLRSELDSFYRGWVECPTCQIKVKVRDEKAVCPVCKAVWDGEGWLKPEKEEKSGEKERKTKKFLSW